MNSKLDNAFAATAANFNHGKITLEQVFEIAKAMGPAAKLQEKIRQTNNGYIFAPTADEFQTAIDFPQFFNLRCTGGTFPHNISIAS